MSGEFRSQPSPELGRLLHALGEEPLAPVSDERAVARETRIVERIEAEIAELTRARRIARRGYLALAAAALALLGAGAVVLRRPAPALVIQREPLPSAPARTPKLEASRTAATALPVDPPRRRRVEPLADGHLTCRRTGCGERLGWDRWEISRKGAKAPRTAKTVVLCGPWRLSRLCVSVRMAS